MIYSKETVTTTSTKSYQIQRAHHLANKITKTIKTHHTNYKNLSWGLKNSRFELKQMKVEEFKEMGLPHICWEKGLGSFQEWSRMLCKSLQIEIQDDPFGKKSQIFRNKIESETKMSTERWV